VEGVFLAALMDRLGLGGREITASGHSKDFVLKVVRTSHLHSSNKTGTARVSETSLVSYRPGDGLQ
jgi:hypothetical protein